jgi:hypothetical protein
LHSISFLALYSCFGAVFPKHCTALSQSELRNFLMYILLRGDFFQCHVFAMKSVQNLKSFWRSSQNYFVLALFSSLFSTINASAG